MLVLLLLCLLPRLAFGHTAASPICLFLCDFRFFPDISLSFCCVLVSHCCIICAVSFLPFLIVLLPCPFGGMFGFLWHCVCWDNLSHLYSFMTSGHLCQSLLSFLSSHVARSLFGWYILSILYRLLFSVLLVGWPIPSNVFLLSAVIWPSCPTCLFSVHIFPRVSVFTTVSHSVGWMAYTLHYFSTAAFITTPSIVLCPCLLW